MSAPAAPTNVLCRSVGNGSLEIQFSPSAGAASYNVYLATAPSGPFNKANLAPVLGTVTRLPNIKFGLTVYVKVTAVNAGGEESAQSATAQDAICNPGTCTLQFESIPGDLIPVGATYMARVGTRAISFITLTSGTCQ